jgi:hypothetical protein
MPKYKGIYKRKNKKGGYTWYAYVDYNFKKYHVPGSYRSTEEARDARNEYEKRLLAQQNITHRKCSVTEYAKIYLSEYKKIWRTSTVIGVESIVRQHIVSVLGNKKINEIEPFDIQKIRSRLYSRNLKKSYIYQVLSTVKHFFITAQQWDFAYKNPTYTLQLPKLSKRQKPEIKPVQIAELI